MFASNPKTKLRKWYSMDYAKQLRLSVLAAIFVAAFAFSCFFTLSAHAATNSSRVLTTTQSSKATQAATTSAKKVALYRVYNPRTREHLYTRQLKEKRVLVQERGWRFEGIGWYSPEKDTVPVYRLFRDGAHHYTASEHERDVLVNERGWKDEGICWYSHEKKNVAVYRVAKPGAALIRAHHYTTSKKERDTLVASRGWKDEGVGWHAVTAGKELKDGWVRKSGAWTYWLEGKQVKGKWIATVHNPEGVSATGYQRYWIDKNGYMAQSRVINPSAARDKGAGKLCYATWTGALLRGKAKISGGMLLADKNGVLASAKGWINTKKYDSSTQRYYLVSKGAYSVAKTGMFTVKGAKYYGWPDDGYVLRNTTKYLGSNWYKADKNGKLTVYKTARTTHINRYVNWALGVASDNSHGYSQYTRWGPDYDCSSLVISSLKAAGFNVGSATYTGNMRDQLTKYGFKWYDRSQLHNIDRGDILLNIWYHTAIYLGNGRQVAATISEKGTIYGKAGDQTGREITEQNYFDYPWDGFLRYVGK